MCTVEIALSVHYFVNHARFNNQRDLEGGGGVLIWSFHKKENLHYDNQYDIHMFIGDY